uniref:Uncharacterized protein n=1 Tax=Chromera velia CCMP2878 TaxID=1169474 RepID=A0A0G4FIP8_9ALVE|mmetsp:Transcript_23854/g.46860  ORF Transcript_23854/g.46860 Transcript_23854/m.46860 type:complete len:117 (+) Transcript_23854:244-594(+)|eukprot:Cvel_17218.t1-p1 / transcript=Cvel_17218.t1 / gene=Cvel_17218 / organism=Chromera_velia_CCMP2878 / gene_product=hypothetical protein / transcript_product=hypothetical protein / location=Cvel_scaffold1362:36940-39866(+) / protein_length=116 / sequence_SO=supercontig / SO=protein_coding / is_pseudo=false
MVKADQLNKTELVELLHTATNTKQKNKVVKLLKRFDSTPRKELDDECEGSRMRIKRYEKLQAFMCWRCDKVKLTEFRGQWDTSKGMKTICHTCYNSLVESRNLRVAQQEYGLVKSK